MSDFHDIVLPKIVETIKTFLTWGVDELALMISTSESQEDNIKTDTAENN